jgi:hypothetical protein
MVESGEVRPIDCACGKAFIWASETGDRGAMRRVPSEAPCSIRASRGPRSSDAIRGSVAEGGAAVVVSPRGDV